MTKPNPYNTSLKATVMRRACVALKPFDQVRFSNKIGSPATHTQGQWIPSTGQVAPTGKSPRRRKTHSISNYNDPSQSLDRINGKKNTGDFSSIKKPKISTHRDPPSNNMNMGSSYGMKNMGTKTHTQTFGFTKADVKK